LSEVVREPIRGVRSGIPISVLVEYTDEQVAYRPHLRGSPIAGAEESGMSICVRALPWHEAVLLCFSPVGGDEPRLEFEQCALHISHRCVLPEPRAGRDDC
jgi:hypothetical protein